MNRYSEGSVARPVNLTTLLKAMPLLNKQGARRFGLTTTLDPASEQAEWAEVSGSAVARFLP